MAFSNFFLLAFVFLTAIIVCDAKRCRVPKCSRRGDCYRRTQRCCRGSIFRPRCSTSIGKTCFTRRVLGVCVGPEAAPVQGCVGKPFGHTFDCNCFTTRTKDGTPVHSQCADTRTVSGRAGPKLHKGVGLAVYSPYHKFVCGKNLPPNNHRCKCSCFAQADIAGDRRYSTRASSRSGRGKGTDCLGLCGAHCNAGKNNRRYTSILIHDICQSFIHSVAPYPFPNNCVDEGSHAISAASEEIAKGRCPPS